MAAIADELCARTADGVMLRIDRVRARGTARGALVCLHAMMADGRYFGARRERSFARAVADAGFDVLVADFRGHGRSVPPSAGADDWSFDDLVELDLPAIVGEAARASGCAPEDLAVLGHSLGGLAATAALGTGRIPSPRRLLLASTTVWLLGRGAPLARRCAIAGYRGITAALGRAPIRALRIGTADEAATYVAQLTWWARAVRWTSLRGVDYLAAMSSIDAPVAAFVGAGDWMCTPDDANRFAARIPGTEPARVIGRGYGDALDADHFELFTRAELRPFWDAVADAI